MATRFDRLEAEVADVPDTIEVDSSLRVTEGSSHPGPAAKKQLITVWHFYRGNNEFWIDGLMDRPNWPSEYCKVGLLRCTMRQAIEVTAEAEWKDQPEVVDWFPWVHYQKEENEEHRETVKGDVIVEEDGSAWFLEGTTYTYLGLYKDKVADAPGGTSTA